ncbi:MAG: hypothetical protein JWN40_3314 [Phycisphaerales bacterium]|nr:hypothetical protein [Phycisphaerales bacterium]
MDRDTLIGMMEMVRQRLLGSLDVIEKSGRDVAAVLAWRPGPGRAHIGWQAMHCAATHDRYLNVFIKGLPAPVDPARVAAFGGGSTPSDQDVPTLAAIRAALDENFRAFTGYLAGLSAADLQRQVGPPDRQRTIAEAAMLMAWHEAHHQGQIHLTWNLYAAAHTGDR